MVYRKFKANGLFTGTEMLEHHAVLVATEDGSIVDIIAESHAGENIEGHEGIICPGFLNCHVHLELSHLRGKIPAKTGLADFVCAVVDQRHYAKEEIQEAIAGAEEEMLRNGIVAAGDICNNTSTISRKEAGRMHYHHFIELSGWNPSLAEERLHQGESLRDAFAQLPESMHHLSLNPHAPYSVSDALWDGMVPHFQGKTVTMHNQETAWEEELFLQGTGEAFRIYDRLKTANPSFLPSGQSSLRTVLHRFAGAGRLVLVHNTFTRQEDLDHIRRCGFDVPIFWCLCPNANLYIENTLPPVDLLRKSEARLVLGTDSLASNSSLSILEEIKTILQAYPQIRSAEILQWATSNGAAALGFQDMLGSFSQGKKPGILLIEHTQDRRITKESSVRRLL